MTRQELYKAMEQEKIIMVDEFIAHLERTPLAELAARWAGVLELAKEHEPRKRRADWLAMTMWNSTSLTVGEDELARREAGRKREEARRAEKERQRREAEIEENLSRRKLLFWRRCTPFERRQLVENHLPYTNDFCQKFVRENYLEALDAMTEKMVLLWFWHAIPPFSPEAPAYKKPESSAA